jgi:nitroimidazol reductase NimA-like FMN-containing flavoprotein (pyridoxamine 5'-phosphate oxidase superfamily)
MTRQEREAFLAGLHIGVLCIPDAGRGPLSAPVWYAYQPGGEIVFVTGASSRKAALLQPGGRVSFVAQSEELPYKYVSVEGPVTGIEPADTEADVRPIAHRYLGQQNGDAYIDATRDSDPGGEIVVRVQPERWLTVDYAKQFPTS